MITVGGIAVESLKKLLKTWTKEGNKYTSIKGNVFIYIGDGSSIGHDASIGNDASIGDGSSIGDRASIGYGASIGHDASIGNDASIGDGSSIGNRSSIGYGSSIGHDASIGNDASIGDRASIGHGASIGYGYKFSVPPLWFSGPKFSIGYHSPGMVNSGCITKPIKWWLENVRRCAEENNYTSVEIDEYEWRIKVLAEWMKRHKVYKEKQGE